MALDDNGRLQRIETRLLAIESHQEKLTTIQYTQQEMKAMLLSLSRNQGIASPIRRLHSLFGGHPSTSTRPRVIDQMLPSSKYFSRPLEPRAITNDQVMREIEGPSQVCLSLILMPPVIDDLSAERWTSIFTFSTLCSRGYGAVSWHFSRATQKIPNGG